MISPAWPGKAGNLAPAGGRSGGGATLTARSTATEGTLLQEGQFKGKWPVRGDGSGCSRGSGDV